jgi:hypothetical protein
MISIRSVVPGTKAVVAVIEAGANVRFAGSLCSEPSFRFRPIAPVILLSAHPGRFHRELRDPKAVVRGGSLKAFTLAACARQICLLRNGLSGVQITAIAAPKILD